MYPGHFSVEQVKVLQAESLVEPYEDGVKHFHNPVDPTEMVDIQAWWQSAVSWCVGLGKAQIGIATGDGEKIEVSVAKAGSFALSIVLYLSAFNWCVMASFYFIEGNSGLVSRSWRNYLCFTWARIQFWEAHSIFTHSIFYL